MRTVTCTTCGAELPSSFGTGDQRFPCPTCGATTTFTGGASLKPSVSASYSVHTANTATARRQALEAAVAGVESAVDSNTVSDAVSAVKQALEVMHELDDCLRRGEWTRAGWTPDDCGLWLGHMGARNAAHHHSSPSAGVVALHSGRQRDGRLTWDIDPAAIVGVSNFNKKYGPMQAREYNARLAGKPVLPGLRQIAARLTSSLT